MRFGVGYLDSGIVSSICTGCVMLDKSLVLSETW